jgi:hypothetical protein
VLKDETNVCVVIEDAASNATCVVGALETPRMHSAQVPPKEPGALCCRFVSVVEADGVFSRLAIDYATAWSIKREGSIARLLLSPASRYPDCISA